MPRVTCRAFLTHLVLLLLVAVVAFAAEPEKRQPYAPDRGADEGDGPHQRLIIRGATVIDGTGAPPIGPMDIVIEGNRIKEVRSVGNPKVPIDPKRRPTDATKEIDGSKMYVLPGFVDMHGHAGGVEQGTTAEYVFKLWLAHGITTVRDPGSGNGLDWTVHERDRSARNEIVAPRIVPYAFTGSSMWEGGAIDSAAQARKFVQWVAKNGGAGIKIIGGSDPVYDPEILAALIDEAKKLKLGSTTHLSQMGVARMNILQAARLGLEGMEHWYGLPEALFDARTLQDYPADYNYLDESHRFGQAGRLWSQAAAPGSVKWNAVMNELLELHFNIDPTFTIYEASRDLMRAMRAEWHEHYTLPSLWKWYEPSRVAHGSYWFDWSTADEIAWKNNYRLWMTFINEYKNRGGRVTTGSDSGYIYKLYGFDYIRELELLQEAGFHPLEVIRAATFHGAEALQQANGKKMEYGLVRPGMLADLVLVEENPLANLKVLYGTGAIRVNDTTGKAERVGGVRYVIKDGIVYDARRLLADVEKIVSAARKR
jgi:imidazolonepropionase-like amidohydrolase